MSLVLARLSVLTESLKLHGMESHAAELAQQAAKEEWDYLSFFERLLQTQIDDRFVRKQSLFTRMAGFPSIKTLAELSSQYDIHVNQIQTWRNQLKDNIGSLFDSGIDQRKDHEQQIKSLQAKIGQLTMENDFLATVLKP